MNINQLSKMSIISSITDVVNKTVKCVETLSESQCYLCVSKCTLSPWIVNLI